MTRKKLWAILSITTVVVITIVLLLILFLGKKQPKGYELQLVRGEQHELVTAPLERQEGEALFPADTEFGFALKSKKGKLKAIPRDAVTITGYPENPDFGTKTVLNLTCTAIYKDYATTFTVNLRRQPISSIVLGTMPDVELKTHYLIGESLDLAGFCLLVNYPNNKQVTLPVTEEMVTNLTDLPLTAGIFTGAGNFSLQLQYKESAVDGMIGIKVDKKPQNAVVLTALPGEVLSKSPELSGTTLPAAGIIDVTGEAGAVYGLAPFVAGVDPLDLAKDITWQSDSHFTGLNLAAKYYVYAYRPETAEFAASEITFVTAEIPQAAVAPLEFTTGYNFIEVTKQPNVLFRLDQPATTEDLGTTLKFTGLMPNREYKLFGAFKFDKLENGKVVTTEVVEASAELATLTVANPYAALDNQTLTYTGEAGEYQFTPLPEFASYGKLELEVFYNDSKTLPVNVGEYAVTVRHRFAPELLTAGTLVIAPAKLTLAPQAAEKTYGTADPAFEVALISGSLGTGDTLSELNPVFDRFAGEDVGTYELTLSAHHPNYDITFQRGEFTIKKAHASAQIKPVASVFGNLLPAAEYEFITAPRFVAGTNNTIDFKFNYETLDTTSKVNPAGTYRGEISGSLTNPNYEIEVVGAADVVIAPRPLAITSPALTKTYGAADPQFSAVYQPEDGEFSALTELSVVRTAGEAVGTYDYVLKSYNSRDFVITADFAPLTITKAPISLKLVDQSFTYGEVDFAALSLELANGALYFGDLLSGFTFTAGTFDSASPVGSYSLTPVIAESSNYLVTAEAGTITINPATLTVKADSFSKMYGEDDPVWTFVVTGFKLSDDDSLITGALTREAGEEPGKYAITQGTLAAGANYTLQFTAGNLTINPAPVYGISLPAQSFVYDGNEHSLAIDGVLPAGVSVTYSANNGQTNVGTYEITATFSQSGSGHILPAPMTAELAITPRPLAIKALPETKVYGADDPTFTYEITTGTIVDGATFSGALTRTAGEAVGSYAISQGSLALTANYDVMFTGANLSITRKPITVTATPQTVAYGEPAVALTFTASGLVGSDALAGALTRATGELTTGYEAAGSYPIGQGTVDDAHNPNYQITFSESDYVITKREVAVAVTYPASFVFDNTDKFTVGTITVSNLLSGHSYSIAKTQGGLAVTEAKNVGTYKVEVQLADLDNYALAGGAVSAAEFSITKAAVAVSADNKLYFNDEVLAPVYHVTSALAGITVDAQSVAKTTVPAGPEVVQPMEIVVTAVYDENGQDITANCDVTTSDYENTLLAKNLISLSPYNKDDLPNNSHNTFKEPVKDPVIGTGYRYSGKYYMNAFTAAGVENAGYAGFATSHYYKYGSLNHFPLFVEGSYALLAQADAHLKIVAPNLVFNPLDPVYTISDKTNVVVPLEREVVKLTAASGFSGTTQLELVYEKYGMTKHFAKLNIEILNGYTNCATFAEIIANPGKNLALTNGIAHQATNEITISGGKTLQGNNYEINSYSASYADDSTTAAQFLVTLNGGTLDNVRVINRAAIAYGSGTDQANKGDSAVHVIGVANSAILNSYITNGRETLEVAGTDAGTQTLTVQNSWIVGGGFAIRQRKGGTITLDNSKIIQRKDVDTGKLGIAVLFFNNSGTSINPLIHDKITVNVQNGTKFHTKMVKSDMSSVIAPNLFSGGITGVLNDLWDNSPGYRYTYEGTQYMFTGCLLMNNADISSNLNTRNPMVGYALTYKYVKKTVLLFIKMHGYMYSYNTNPGETPDFSQTNLENLNVFASPAYVDFQGAAYE